MSIFNKNKLDYSLKEYDDRKLKYNCKNFAKIFKSDLEQSIEKRNILYNICLNNLSYNRNQYYDDTEDNKVINFLWNIFIEDETKDIVLVSNKIIDYDLYNKDIVLELVYKDKHSETYFKVNKQRFISSGKEGLVEYSLAEKVKEEIIVYKGI